MPEWRNYSPSYLNREGQFFSGKEESMAVGNQIQLSETPAVVKIPPPELGDSTREVMEKLGFSENEVDELESHTPGIRKQFFRGLEDGHGVMDGSNA